MTQTNYATNLAAHTAEGGEYFTHQIAFAGLSATETSLARIELPAGHYLIEARAVFACQLANDSPPDAIGFVICRLAAGAAQDKARFTFVKNAFVPVQQFFSVRLGLAVSLGEGGVVEVFGSVVGRASVFAESLNLLAQRIEKLTVIPPPDPGGGGGGGEGDP